MKERRHIVAVCLLAAALLAGCCRDAEPTLQTEIAVRTGVTSMVKRINSITNDAQLQAQDIRIDAYYHGTETSFLDGAKLHYDTDHDPSPAWVFWNGATQVHYYWPFEGSKTTDGTTASTLNFVGLCPFSKPAYIGTPTYSHTTGISVPFDMSTYLTPASQADMQEYLIAVLDSQTLETQTEAGGALPMAFKHPLSQIKFAIAEGSGTDVTINSIRIADLYTAGTCSFDGTDMTWGSYSGTDTLKIDGLALKYGTPSTETAPVYIMPYSGTKTLIVNGTWTDWSNVTKDITTEVAFEWQSGYIYTYTLTVTPDALIVNTNKFTEQW